VPIKKPVLPRSDTAKSKIGAEIRAATNQIPWLIVLANSSPADCGRDGKAHNSSIRFITQMLENSPIDFAKQKTTRRST